MCFGPVCRINPSVTGLAHIITPYVTGLPARSIIPDVIGSAPVILRLHYVYLQCISVEDRFRVWLHFILMLIDPSDLVPTQSLQFS